MISHDMVNSKNDFLHKGNPVTYETITTDSAGNTITQTHTKNLPRAKMWIRFKSPTELLHVAELLDIKVVSKRKKDYVFAEEGTIYYAKD
ncbi:MAG: hypothetical protein ACTSRG_04460 [Candidatus Helarchaeota archaeon]